MAMRLKSGISQTNWCTLHGGIGRFEPAQIAFDSEAKQNISWFDQMFEGGIRIPDSEDKTPRPLTFLVTGPPGSGKTTLASELCYRLAKNEQGNKDNKNEPEHLFTLYLSTDTETDKFIQNVKDLGWQDANRFFLPFDKKLTKRNSKVPSAVLVWGREKIQPEMEKMNTISDLVKASVEALEKWVTRVSPKGIINRLNQLPFRPINTASENVAPDILVVDSLNIVETDKQSELFQQFIKACKAHKMVIFVLDSGSQGEHKFWEYFCDTVIRLDYEYVHDYYVRTIEVVKARYQSHAWGKHQLKIYPRPSERSEPENWDPGNRKVQDHNIAMRRAHPYRKAGGIFIYPSIHSYLSVYKRKSLARDIDRDETYPEKLNDVIQIPRGRCTAFIGERGGHKSHLGYLHILNRLVKYRNETGLIISLREDEEATKQTMGRIMEQEFPQSGGIDDLEYQNRLEVLYYPPGYITPEEFFHRMFISIHRLKMQGGHLTVLFNSLDQLSARFPLCAKQEIFIPGIVQALSGEGITSICIAVNEPGQPVEQYGLLPMADLILSFSLRGFPVLDYYDHINASWAIEENGEIAKKVLELKRDYEARRETLQEAIVLQVVRFSGGQRAGARGILELVNEKDLVNSLYSKAGLHFTPLNPKYSQGKPLDQIDPGR
jgi:KaiC/GvpD/RAD55 family RecA-like ATPase